MFFHTKVQTPFGGTGLRPSPVFTGPLHRVLCLPLALPGGAAGERLAEGEAAGDRASAQPEQGGAGETASGQHHMAAVLPQRFQRSENL